MNISWGDQFRVARDGARDRRVSALRRQGSDYLCTSFPGLLLEDFLSHHVQVAMLEAAWRDKNCRAVTMHVKSKDMQAAWRRFFEILETLPFEPGEWGIERTGATLCIRVGLFPEKALMSKLKVA